MRDIILNGLLVKTDGRKIVIYDKFADLSQKEISVIIKYLVSEGFIYDSVKKISVSVIQQSGDGQSRRRARCQLQK